MNTQASEKDSFLRALKAAFPCTAPVLTGFLFLGVAYGILMTSKGFGGLWAPFVSFFAYCGSMQFVAVSLLTSPFDPLGAFLLSFMVNARHLFYGVAMLDKYKGAGRLKAPLIFLMCDETFSINCSAQPPLGVSRAYFYFCISLLNYLYWGLASLAGALAGSFINIEIPGIDFVLTALFVVIFIDKWSAPANRIPLLIGGGCTALALLVFGGANFLLPAMALVLIVLLLLKSKLGGAK